MVQALCRPNGTGPYSRSVSTTAKLAVPSFYPATSVTFGCLYRASAHNVPNLSTPGASEETPKIDAISRRRSGRDARFIARPPPRTVRAAFPHTACMGVSLSRVHHAIFVVLCCFILLFDPRREHSSIPTAHCRRRRAQRRSRTALLQRRRRLVLDGREHGGRLPVIGWSAAMIRGEPAIGREQSREPRLYSVEPTWGLDHEAVIRFCGQGSEAAGPFSQRHCSHSRIRIAATSDRHRLPGSSNAVRCRTLFVLSRSRVLLIRVLLTPPAATRHRPAPHRS